MLYICYISLSCTPTSFSNCEMHFKTYILFHFLDFWNIVSTFEILPPYGRGSHVENVYFSLNVYICTCFCIQNLSEPILKYRTIGSSLMGNIHIFPFQLSFFYYDTILFTHVLKGQQVKFQEIGFKNTKSSNHCQRLLK